MTLPGMPIRAGDPGVFFCGPEDIAPWESQALPVKRGVPEVPRPAITARKPRVWLVLAACPNCVYITQRYCSEHGADNWWLKTMASAPRRRNSGNTKAAPSTLDQRSPDG